MKTTIFLSVFFAFIYSLGSAQTMLKDIYQDSESSYPMRFVAAGSYIYFIAQDDYKNLELWKTDGTEAGTVLVKDINPLGDGCGDYNSADPCSSPLYTIGNEVLFFANDYVHGFELWKSDGTEAGTFMIRDFDSSSTSGIFNLLGYVQQGKSIQLGKSIVFNAGGQSTGQELWISDGTDNGTHIIKDISPGVNWIEANAMTTFDSLIFSVVYSTNGNSGIWKTDGTNIGTMLFTDQQYSWLFPCGKITMLTQNKGFLACPDIIPDTGVELYLADSSGNISLVKDINPGFGNSTPENFFIFHDKLFFSADDIVHGNELWISDGTDIGTLMVKDIMTGLLGSKLYGFTEFKNELYFIATSDSGKAIWKTDGTFAGTIEVIPPSHIQPYTNYLTYTSASYLNVIGDYMYFGGAQQGTSVQLWRTDGTDAGTQLVADICPGCSGNTYGYYGEFYSDGQNIYFAGNENVHGQEPWILSLNTIGIHEPTDDINELIIYPNPAREYFTIEAQTPITTYKVELIDLFGRRVRSINNLSQAEIRIDRGNLPSGIYSVLLFDEEQRILISGKVIFQ